MSLNKCMIVAVLVVCVAAVCFGERSVAGGKSPMDKDGAKAKEMAAFAVAELGDQYTLVAIAKAESQVTAGNTYHLTLRIKKTGSGSIPNANPKTYTCKVQIHVKKWENYQEVVKHCCDLE